MPTAGKYSIIVRKPTLVTTNSSRPDFHEFRRNSAMHFCITGQYTPRSLNAILENPTTNRQEAAAKVIEAGGGKLVSMYSVAADGPGVLVIFDVPDPSIAPAISGLTVATGALQNVKLTRLFTQDEIKQVRQNAVKLRASYKPPGS
ncbi:GYD domain-containing protein [Bradyrhizobium manausense]|nr:GYD domain-containing protein [Bradyrhizobium manausense]